MDNITSLFNLEKESFSNWVSAEKHRLPGATDGFARFLALLRMTRPAQVVWLSGGEPGNCGYDETNVARILVDLLGYGSRLVWVRRDEGASSLEISHLFGASDQAASALTIVCVPAGYEITGHPHGVVGVHVARTGDEWEFRHAVTVAGSAEPTDAVSDEQKGQVDEHEQSESTDVRPRRRKR